MLVNLTLNGCPPVRGRPPDLTLFDFCRSARLQVREVRLRDLQLRPVHRASRRRARALVLRAHGARRRPRGHHARGRRDEGRRELLAQCLAEEGAEQCGFCAPGLEMAVLALDAAHPGADDETVRRYLSGNLCRCSGYASQMRAIRRLPDAPRQRRRPAAARRCPMTPSRSPARSTPRSRARLPRRTPGLFSPARPSTPPTSPPRGAPW